MSVSKAFTYKHRILEAGELVRAFKATFARASIDPANLKFSIHESLEDETRVTRDASLEELQSICDPTRRDITLHTSMLCGGYLYIHLGKGTKQETYDLSFSAPNPQILFDVHNAFLEVLRLEEMPKATGETLSELAERLKAATLEEADEWANTLMRIEKLEDAVFPQDRRLRCFLSYRFTDADEIVALRVQQFLTLLDIEVLSGASYEPRQVSEKVLSKLRQPLDFIVLLIAGTGESTWTRDEIGTAIHKGIAFIPLVQKGISFEPGLFADVEYVEFDSGHIGDSFLKLLQATCFIREQRRAASRGDAGNED